MGVWVCVCLCVFVYVNKNIKGWNSLPEEQLHPESAKPSKTPPMAEERINSDIVYGFFSH